MTLIDGCVQIGATDDHLDNQKTSAMPIMNGDKSGLLSAFSYSPLSDSVPELCSTDENDETNHKTDVLNSGVVSKLASDDIAAETIDLKTVLENGKDHSLLPNETLKDGEKFVSKSNKEPSDSESETNKLANKLNCVNSNHSSIKELSKNCVDTSSKQTPICSNINNNFDSSRDIILNSKEPCTEDISVKLSVNNVNLNVNVNSPTVCSSTAIDNKHTLEESCFSKDEEFSEKTAGGSDSSLKLNLSTPSELKEGTGVSIVANNEKVGVSVSSKEENITHEIQAIAEVKDVDKVVSITNNSCMKTDNLYDKGKPQIQNQELVSTPKPDGLSSESPIEEDALSDSEEMILQIEDDEPSGDCLSPTIKELPLITSQTIDLSDELNLEAVKDHPTDDISQKLIVNEQIDSSSLPELNVKMVPEDPNLTEIKNISSPKDESSSTISQVANHQCDHLEKSEADLKTLGVKDAENTVFIKPEVTKEESTNLNAKKADFMSITSSKEECKIPPVSSGAEIVGIPFANTIPKVDKISEITATKEHEIPFTNTNVEVAEIPVMNTIEDVDEIPTLSTSSEEGEILSTNSLSEGGKIFSMNSVAEKGETPVKSVVEVDKKSSVNSTAERKEIPSNTVTEIDETSSINSITEEKEIPVKADTEVDEISKGINAEKQETSKNSTTEFGEIPSVNKGAKIGVTSSVNYNSEVNENSSENVVAKVGETSSLNAIADADSSSVSSESLKNNDVENSSILKPGEINSTKKGGEDKLKKGSEKEGETMETEPCEQDSSFIDEPLKDELIVDSSSNIKGTEDEEIGDKECSLSVEESSARENTKISVDAAGKCKSTGSSILCNDASLNERKPNIVNSSQVKTCPKATSNDISEDSTSKHSDIFKLETEMESTSDEFADYTKDIDSKTKVSNNISFNDVKSENALKTEIGEKINNASMEEKVESKLKPPCLKTNDPGISAVQSDPLKSGEKVNLDSFEEKKELSKVEKESFDPLKENTETVSNVPADICDNALELQNTGGLKNGDSSSSNLKLLLRSQEHNDHQYTTLEEPKTNADKKTAGKRSARSQENEDECKIDCKRLRSNSNSSTLSKRKMSGSSDIENKGIMNNFKRQKRKDQSRETVDSSDDSVLTGSSDCETESTLDNAVVDKALSDVGDSKENTDSCSSFEPPSSISSKEECSVSKKLDDVCDESAKKFSRFQVNLRNFSRQDLEEMITLKMLEVLKYKGIIGDQQKQLLSLHEQCSTQRKLLTSIRKQYSENNVIMKKFLEKSAAQLSKGAVVPLKATRSVGLQVALADNPCIASNLNPLVGPSRKILNASKPETSSVLTNPSKPSTLHTSTISSTSTTTTVVNQQTVKVLTPVARSVPSVPLSQASTPSIPSKTAVRLKASNMEVIDLVDDSQQQGKSQDNTSHKTLTVSQAPTGQIQTTRLMSSSVNNRGLIGAQLKNGQIIQLQNKSGVLAGNQFQLLSTTNNRPLIRPASNLNLSGARNIKATPLRMMRTHPAPLPALPLQVSDLTWKAKPPKPTLRIGKNGSGITLSWTLNGYDTDKYAEIVSYQLFAYQEGPEPPNTDLWKKVGDVKALPLPMACTLTKFVVGHRYHFAVQAVDIHSRVGDYSTPDNILLN